MEFSHGRFNQDVAKTCGSEWEHGKIDRALSRCGKKSGSKWEFGKMDRALITMWKNRVDPNGNLAKWIGL